MTTETNAERIKRIKEMESLLVDGFGEMTEDTHWLIQQAEDRQKLEDALLSWVDAKEKIKRKHEIVSGYFLEEREKRFDAEVKAEKLEKENARLREALEFYADEDKWDEVNLSESPWNPYYVREIHNDRGETARKALNTQEDSK